MDIEKQFEFLVKDYGLKHSYQEFKNCFDGHWFVYTHSFYNDSGCFTIHNLPQRGELDFYYAKEFSSTRKNLCEELLNIYSVEKDIWDKNKSLFQKVFGMNDKKVLQILVEVIKTQVENTGQFFGIKINK